ncbi:nitrite reductase small subunit NirD [Marinobacterium sediminicola]|uniref:Nitrite reductase (NADH) small subunit n=1 Tax=Marinobacterium sediminicola TaxID=518898 RepID=A0ABY1S294_9GAMM|nr:nitrite reductase small subunit NirD [Marinobacterium sediminicola]ULG68505.1 nitrite reductase small subunit NirD [Marinobacterium sediminicola]SMR76685.1 nitrite reductase (NADH) small subunit [Marinobacterium sediminicola]
MSNNMNWRDLCGRDDLIPGSGVAVKIGSQAAALYWPEPGREQLFALAHRDPFSQAEVLAWGLLCEQGGEWSVAAPLYKQHFRLNDGVCLEQPEVVLPTWPVRFNGDRVEVGLS